MLRWLTRLFKQNVEAETDPAVDPAPEAPPQASSEPKVSTALLVLDRPSGEAATERPASPEPEPKETCPTCGRTSVFAGPPGQRFCTYCALRDELFERSAAAQE